MVYIVVSGRITDDVMLELLTSGGNDAVISVETILHKLPLFLPFIRKSAALA